MRPSKSIIALAALLLVASYAIALACDHSTESAKQAKQATETVQATAQVSEAVPEAIDVTVTCDLVEQALNDVVLLEAGRCSSERPTASAISSIRAGVNLTRALSRAMAHLAVTVARTAYHTMTALT